MAQHRKGWRNQLRRSLRDIILGYFLILLMMVLFEPHLVYHPLPDGPSDPQEKGAIHFTRKLLANGASPEIVYWENAAPPKAPTLLYFHGNGGGLFTHVAALNLFDKMGLHVIAMEYPGYPGAAGTPSETLIVRDALTLFDHVQQSHPHIIVWGFSIGSGVAAQLVGQREAEAVILEAPFSAAVDRAEELFPYLPVRYVMRNTYDSRKAIAHNHAPLLILHGDADGIIPIAHGRALFAAANEPKQMKEYPGFGHLNLIGSHAYEDALAFIKQVEKR